MNSTTVDEALSRAAVGASFVERLLPQLVDLVKYSKSLPQGEEHAIRRLLANDSNDENARGSRDFLASSKDLGFRSLQAAHQIFRFLEQPIHRNTQPEDASFRPFERRLGALRSPILVFYGPFQRSLHRLSASC